MTKTTNQDKEGMRGQLMAKVDAFTRARLRLSDRIFSEGRMPRSDEWTKIEAFDEKIEGFYEILDKFYPAAGTPADPPTWVKEALY